jgi:hypothetical protein
MESAKVFTPLKSKYLLITADYIVPFLISFSIVFVGYLAMYSDLFKIRDIDCQLDFEACQNESLLAEMKYKGQKIFKFDQNLSTGSIWRFHYPRGKYQKSITKQSRSRATVSLSSRRPQTPR